MPGPRQLSLFGASAKSCESRGARRLVQIGTRMVEIQFTRSRRRTIGISIDADGLAVAAPHLAPWVEIEKSLREKAHWIQKKLDTWANAERPLRLCGASGEVFPLRGRMLTLVLSTGVRRAELSEDRLLLQLRRPHEAARVRTELVHWLKTHALETLEPRVAHYAALLERPAPQVAVSNARTQWGVCTRDGRIRLSWRLVHLPPALADYVVAHEVAHLVELNHSARFWKVVETLYPDCRAARHRLNLAARSLPIF